MMMIRTTPNNNNNKNNLLWRRVVTTTTCLVLLAGTGIGVGVDVVHAAISDECQSETEPLLTDDSLQIAQSIIFEDYTESFNDKCDIGLDNIGCSIKFEGDERTYKALCEGSGGQLYKRPVILSCAFGAYKTDLGYIPTCIGSSCNVTNVGPTDVETDQVDSFLNNLTLTGCTADSSDGHRPFSWWSLWSLESGTATGGAVMLMIPFLLLL